MSCQLKLIAECLIKNVSYAIKISTSHLHELVYTGAQSSSAGLDDRLLVFNALLLSADARHDPDL